jgi:spermidine synthase
MQPTFLDKIKSYLWDIHVESVMSEQSGQLDLYLCKGRYQLCTENSIYSYADKYINFTDAFKRLHLDMLPGNSVLLPGFGLGSIPYMLEKVFKKDFEYTGIEIDEEIIYLASKYVIDDLKSPISLLCADAESFVYADDEVYDMICFDVFVDAVVPEEFEHTEFIESLAERLHPDGLLMFNRLNHTEEQKLSTGLFYEKVFSVIFPHACIIPVEGNSMLISNKDYLKVK